MTPAARLNQVLLSPLPSRALRAAGALFEAIPELRPLVGLTQTRFHHLDVFEHTLAVVDAAPAEPALRWAALLHDAGKAQTRAVTPDGIVHFTGHEAAGAAIAERALARLGFEPAFRQRVTRLVSMHMRVHFFAPAWGKPAQRRLMRDAGDALGDLFALGRADALAHHPAHVPAALERLDALERACAELRATEAGAIYGCPLDGHQLMALAGRVPGPWIERAKAYLTALVLEGKLAAGDRAQAERCFAAWLKENGETAV